MIGMVNLRPNFREARFNRVLSSVDTNPINQPNPRFRLLNEAPFGDHFSLLLLDTFL